MKTNSLVTRAKSAVRNWVGAGMVQYIGISGGDGYSIAYGSSPRSLRENLMWSESGINIRFHARRAARANEYIGRFLMRAQDTAIFDNRVEPPIFPGVPAEVAKLVALKWAAWWMKGLDSRGRRLVMSERQMIYDWLVDGEVFFDWRDGNKLRVVPSDMIVDHSIADGDYSVSEWRLPRRRSIAASALLQVAHIDSNWQIRGKSYLSRTLPEVFSNMEYRDNSSQSIRDLSKVAAVTTNSATGSAHGLPPVGGQGYDAMGGQDTQEGAGVQYDRFRGTVPGVVPDLKMGQKLEHADYGPPERAELRANAQPAAIAIALGVSETELTGDHVKHNFASLQVAEARDMKTYTSLRQRWYGDFRVPIFRYWLDMAIANGDLPGTIVKYYHDLIPLWAGPKLVTAQPLKDAQATKANAELGQVNLRRLAASQGENAEKNAMENAAIMANFEQSAGGLSAEEIEDSIAAALDNLK